MNGKQVLIIDDALVVLKALSNKLRSKGYGVLTAADCATGLQTARRERPDLILVDISFPPALDEEGAAWDGFLVLSWLKRFEETKTIPVIIMTGSDPEKHRARAASSGAVAFFRKPLEGDELLGTVRNLIGNDTDAKRDAGDVHASSESQRER